MMKNIIAKARQRDPDAITALYREYVQRIARYIDYRVHDAAVVEDLTANVFLTMVERLPEFEDRGVPFEAWLYRIAATEVAGYYRREGRPHVELLPEAMSVPEAAIQQLQEAEAVRRAVNQLESDDQLILFFRFVEDRSHQDVGKLVGKSARAVATAQHRALKKLAVYLEGITPDG
ncbi:MAG: sigma-70 family RNA polymerase sigma factor [Chloroflexi bacterium]|nr:sigma-70 family RNA polymerase sigma factor [Chloroflexota bacterium]